MGTVKLDFVPDALGYARDVIDGTVPACRFVKQAAQRFLDDLDRQGQPDFPYYFDEDKANRICLFIEGLKHVKGPLARAGLTIKLEPWQCFTLVNVFGWLHTETGKRRFRKAYIEVPRGNAKSTMSSGVALYALAADGEEGAEVYSLATKRDQARIVFADAQAMVRKDNSFAAHFNVGVYAHYIAQPKSNSRFVALSSDSSKLDGLNIHVAILDEVHAWHDRTLFEVIESGIGKRDQSLMFMITTSGYDTQNICYEIRSFIANILSGIVQDESTFGMIYTIDEGDDWMSESSWRKANPNWGISVMPEVIRASALKAQVTPAAQAGFKTKHLNLWAAAGRTWMQQDQWDACGDPDLSIEEVKHLPCYVGVDLASKVDINAILRVFFDVENNRKYVFTKFYLPEEAVKTSKNSLLYRDWAERGYITITPGNIADLQLIEDDIENGCAEVDDTRALGFDPYQATQMMTRLMNKGLPVVEVRPTKLNLSEPMKQVEADVLAHNVTHDANPVMSWMVSNIVFKIDSRDNMYPNKDSVEQKIDGGLALMTAYNRLMAEQQAEETPTIFAV